jgi:hypothetical protein
MKNYKFLFLILFVSTVSLAQKSVLIRFKPKPGSTLTANMGMNMDMKMKVGEQDILTKMEMGFVMLYNNLDRKKDVNEIEMSFDRVTMKMTNLVMNGTYDSDIKGATDPFAKKIAEGFTGVIKNPVSMKINTIGEFAEPLDISKLFAKIPAAKAKELEEQMSNQFIQFPKEKVKVGGTWAMESTMNQVGVVKFTYTLVAIEKKTLLLTVKGDLLSSSNENLKLLSSGIEGTVVLDKKTGETLKSDMTMDMQMQITAQGKTMETNMIAKINLSATHM